MKAEIFWRFSRRAHFTHTSSSFTFYCCKTRSEWWKDSASRCSHSKSHKELTFSCRLQKYCGSKENNLNFGYTRKYTNREKVEKWKMNVVFLWNFPIIRWILNSRFVLARSIPPRRSFIDSTTNNWWELERERDGNFRSFTGRARLEEVFNFKISKEHEVIQNSPRGKPSLFTHSSQSMSKLPSFSLYHHHSRYSRTHERLLLLSPKPK